MFVDRIGVPEINQWFAERGEAISTRRSNLGRLQAIDIEFLHRRTGQDREVVEAWLGGDDVAFLPQNALKLGLVDEVIP